MAETDSPFRAVANSAVDIPRRDEQSTLLYSSCRGFPWRSTAPNSDGYNKNRAIKVIEQYRIINHFLLDTAAVILQCCVSLRFLTRAVLLLYI